MLGAERKCRKLYRGAYEFSPEVKSWIEKGRVIQGLLRHRLTGAGNGGNARRAARRTGLQDLSTMSNSSLAGMTRECKKKFKSMLAE